MKAFKQIRKRAIRRMDRMNPLEGLQEAEERIEKIKITCECMTENVQSFLVIGKDISIEKRIRKVPEFWLGSGMIHNGKLLGDASGWGEVLSKSGPIEIKLAEAQVAFKMNVEKNVLRPFMQVLETDLPRIKKLEKSLRKNVKEMELAKAKWEHASVYLNDSHVEKTKYEWETLKKKVEQLRDLLEEEMYGMIARESDFSRLIVAFIGYQMEYHHSMYEMLLDEIPTILITKTNIN